MTFIEDMVYGIQEVGYQMRDLDVLVVTLAGLAILGFLTVAGIQLMWFFANDLFFGFGLPTLVGRRGFSGSQMLVFAANMAAGVKEMFGIRTSDYFDSRSLEAFSPILYAVQAAIEKHQNL